MAMEKKFVVRHAHDDAVLSVAYNSQRKELLTGGQDAQIKAWEMDTGRAVRTLADGHLGWVTGLAYCASVRMLLSCSIDAHLIVWDARSKYDWVQRINTGSQAHCLAWDDRRQYAAVGGDRVVTLYALVKEHADEPQRRKDRPILRIVTTIRDPHGDFVRGVVLSDTGRLFAATFDSTVVLADVAQPQGATAAAVERHRRAHSAGISALAQDATNNLVMTGSFDKMAKIWTPEGKALQTLGPFADTITGLCFVPGIKCLWLACNSLQPIVYDPRRGADVTKYTTTAETMAALTGAGPGAHERLLRLFTLPGTGEVVGTTTSRHVVVWRYNPHGATALVRGHTDWIETVFPAAGAQIVSAGSDLVVRLWAPSARLHRAIYEPVAALEGHATPVLCGAFSAEANAMVTCGEGGEVLAWFLSAPATGGPDEGRTFITATNDGAAPRAPDLAEAVSVCLGHHGDRVPGVVIVHVPQGPCAVTVGWDRTVRWWLLSPTAAAEAAALTDSSDNPVLLRTLANAHDDDIHGVAAGPGVVASCSADHCAKIWDLASGGLRASLHGHTGEVTRIAWCGAHGVWVTGGDDATVHLWPEHGGAALREIVLADPVSALSVDDARGLVLVACNGDTHGLLIYDPRLAAADDDPVHVGTYRGHESTIRSILHVPDADHYVTAGWDHSLRTWAVVGASAQAAGDTDEARSERKIDAEATPSYASLHPLHVPRALVNDRAGALAARGTARSARPNMVCAARKRVSPAPPLTAPLATTGAAPGHCATRPGPGRDGGESVGYGPAPAGPAPGEGRAHARRAARCRRRGQGSRPRLCGARCRRGGTTAYRLLLPAAHCHPAAALIFGPSGKHARGHAWDTRGDQVRWVDFAKTWLDLHACKPRVGTRCHLIWPTALTKSARHG